MSERVDLEKAKAWVREVGPVIGRTCSGGWWPEAIAHIEALVAEVERLRAVKERLAVDLVLKEDANARLKDYILRRSL